MTAPNSSERPEQPTLSGLKKAEIALADPLKEETRKARLYLLGVSMVSIAIVWTGLVPQEITTLGIQFGEANRQALLLILALLVVYFLVAFAVYGAADYLAARYAYVNAVWSERMTESRKQEEKYPREVAAVQARSEKYLARAEEAGKVLDRARETAESAQQEVEQTEKELELAKRAMQPTSERLRAAKEAHNRAQAKVQQAQKAVMARKEDYEAAGHEWFGTNMRLKKLRRRVPDGFLDLSWKHPVSTGERPKDMQEQLAIQAALDIERYSKVSPFVSLARRLFEFLLPLFVGVYAIYALLLA